MPRRHGKSASGQTSKDAADVHERLGVHGKNTLERMSKDFAVRARDIVNVADKTSDPDASAYEKLGLLIREHNTLHTEELKAEEDVTTAQRRLGSIKEREKEIKAFLERLDRIVAMCINQDYSPRTTPSGDTSAGLGPLL